MINDRIDVINHLIKKYNYKFYLEIGVKNGECIRKVACPTKHGVDPVKLCSEVNFNMTSDIFFEKFCRENLYDIIFIDGHHDSEYVCRDLNNSLKMIKNNGTIVLHDCKPHTEKAACKSVNGNPPQGLWEWNGDSYKVMHSCVENYNKNLKCYTVEVDHGVGVVQKIKNKFVEITYNDSYSYKTMMENPEKEINCISTEKFLEIFP